MKNRPAIVVLTVIVLLAAALGLWLKLSREPAVPIAGTESALPRASAESEFVLPAALEEARAQATRGGARALLVHRRGHRVFEYFASGSSGDTQVQGGDLAAAVLALALHEPGQAEQIDTAAAASLVSERLWLPLRAGDASLSDDHADGPRRCCMRAKLDDWMRVGDLLLGQGSYLGERFVSPDAVRQLLASRTAPPAGGDEPLAASDGTSFVLEPGIRLWIVPRRNLAILVWGDAKMAGDTLVPNIVLRGLNDQSPAVSGDISDIVPGH